MSTDTLSPDAPTCSPDARARRRGPPDCASCPSRARSEWCSLGSAALGRLNAAKVPHGYAAGDALYHEGHAFTGLFCIEQGTVLLRRGEGTEAPAVVGLAEPGQTLGHRAYFAGGRHEATARAATACRACFVDKSVLDALLANEPALARRFLARLSADCERAEASLVRATSTSVEARLARLLLELRDHHGRVDDDGNLVLELPLSRRELASFVGARPESISRAIATLAARGAATFAGRRVVVADLDALFDASEQR